MISTTLVGRATKLGGAILIALLALTSFAQEASKEASHESEPAKNRYGWIVGEALTGTVADLFVPPSGKAKVDFFTNAKRARSSKCDFLSFPAPCGKLLSAETSDRLQGGELFRFDSPDAKPGAGRATRTSGVSTQGAQAPAADAEALAKKLSNPVASLISFPLQSNFDFGLGPTGDGFKYTLNVQPVIPISLSKDWNLISRTIIPIIGQKDVVANGTSQFGLGDIAQAFFFSPNKSEPFVWGLGPQVLIPTATNEFLGAKNLALGPTGLILKQRGHWTVGALAGHLWTVARSSSRPTLSITNLQPFISYSTKTAWTYGMSAETTYDWKNDQWNVPIFFNVSKLVRFGKQPVSIGGSLKCWAASSPTGPEGCGIRITITPLFPKK